VGECVKNVFGSSLVRCGIGNYPSAYLAFKVGIGQNTLYPHNFYLGLLGEAGIFGFVSVILFFGLWVGTFSNIRKIVSREVLRSVS